MPRRVPSYKLIARERVERLFELAEGVKERQRLADRYVELAWRIVRRYNLRLPPHLKRRFCRKCLSYFRPGVTCRVRIHPAPPRIVITCLRCGRLMRFSHKARSVNTGKGNLSEGRACEKLGPMYLSSG